MNGKANLKENNTLKVPAAYIIGTFYVGGDFKVEETENTYFGESSENWLKTFGQQTN